MFYPLILLIPIVGISAFLAVRAARRRGAVAEEVSTEGTLLAIKVPKGSEKMPLAAEQMFAALHGLLKVTPETQEHLTFEIAANPEGIFFYSWVPKHLRQFVESQVYAQYPDAEIREARNYTGDEEFSRKITEGKVSFAATTLNLAREDYFPIRTFRDFDVDPLAAITGALSEVGPQEKIFLQILLRPLGDVWQAEGYQYVEMVREGTSPVSLDILGILKDVGAEFVSFVPATIKNIISPQEVPPPPKPSFAPVRLSSGKELELKLIEGKLSRMGFETAIRVLAVGKDSQTARSLLRSITASFRQFSTADLNSFAEGEIKESDSQFLKSFQNRTFPQDSYILNTEELASVFHLPNVSVETPTIAWSEYKRGEPPLNLPTKDCTFFAKTTFRDQLVKFGIKREDRRRHLYAIGKTGTGKTHMFRNMIIQDMENGEGVAVLDPHGELVEELLDFIPDGRVEDVILFDPADREHPPGFNMLELTDPTQKSLMASGLIDVFQTRFAFSWGPRMEHLLRNCILTLLAIPNTTLLGITRLLQDKNYRNYIVYKIRDPVIKAFWEEEFQGMLGNPRLVTEAIAPIQNRLGQFLSSPIIRNIVGQAHSGFDLGEAMNEGRILLVNLSKGKLGADNSNILGSMLISRMQFEAMQRVSIPESERRDFYLYVDEFQNFASGAFANILSEARKYHLCLNLTHQYIAQLPEEMRDAVFGNVGTIVSFTLGASDAEVLAEEFAPVFSQEDLISLEKYNIYLELMIDGMSSRPFSAVTLPALGEKTGNREKVLQLSREKHGSDMGEVEGLIGRWAERQFDLGLAKAEESRQERKVEVKAPPTQTGGQIRGEVVLKPKGG